MRVRVFPAVAGLVFLVAGAFAQTTSTASATTAPRTWDFLGHYNKRLAAITADVEKLSGETTDVVVLLGDSLTEGFKITDLSGRCVVNMGISGDQIDMTTQPAGIRRRAELVKRVNPQHIFLLIGINDFGSGKSLEDAQAQYRGLVDILVQQSPKAKLHIQSLLPTSGKYAKHLPKVNAMNEFLKKMSAEKNLDYLDLFSLMANEKGEIRAEFTTEGLHLTPAAYEAWKNLLEQVLSSSKAK